MELTPFGVIYLRIGLIISVMGSVSLDHPVMHSFPCYGSAYDLWRLLLGWLSLFTAVNVECLNVI